MTHFGKFLVATVISFFCMVGALGAKHPVPLILMAVLCWVAFARSLSSSNARRNKEKQLYEEFLRFKNKR